MPSVNQEAGPHRTETLLACQSWTCSLQSREESVSVVHELPGLSRVSAQSLPGLRLVFGVPSMAA